MTHSIPLKPWESQPEYTEWVDDTTGYTCAAFFNPGTQTMCGYVFLPVNHPWAGKKWNELSFIQIHGGVTFSQDSHLRFRMIPDGRTWMVGFDCGHPELDYRPKYPIFMNSFIGPIIIGEEGPAGNPEDYKTIDFVKIECSRLAKQAREAENG
jgi:hypothetical protein